MKQALLYLSGIFLCLTLFSCYPQEAIQPDYYDFLGLWESDVFAIEIFQNGSGWFNSNRWWEQSFFEGKVFINDNRIKIIDEERGVKRIRIDQFPTTEVDPDTGEEFTFMEIRGVVVYLTR